MHRLIHGGFSIATLVLKRSWDDQTPITKISGEHKPWKYYPWKGQFQQDQKLAEHVFRNKKDGYFIELGAADGLTLSNTYAFEAGQMCFVYFVIGDIFLGVCLNFVGIFFKNGLHMFVNHHDFNHQFGRFKLNNFF